MSKIKITRAEQISYDVEQTELTVLESNLYDFVKKMRVVNNLTITRIWLRIAEYALKQDNKATNQNGKIIYPKVKK